MLCDCKHEVVAFEKVLRPTVDDIAETEIVRMPPGGTCVYQLREME